MKVRILCFLMGMSKMTYFQNQPILGQIYKVSFGVKKLLSRFTKDTVKFWARIV